MCSNRTKESIGINTVVRIVTEHWESGWQEYCSKNDDGIDGLILMRKGSEKPIDTGGIVFVQIKCGADGYRKDLNTYPKYIGVNLGKKYIDLHKPRWARVPGPAVLIFVDNKITNKFKSHPAWWVDLKDLASYSPTNQGMILIPKSQRFSEHSKGEFHKLCGSRTQDRVLNTIKLERSETIIPRLGKTESLRNDAWEFYKNWRENPEERNNSKLGNILVNRVGWKHITRRDRLPERIVQSWLLLGAAKQIISEESNVFNLGRASVKTLADGSKLVQDYLGLRSKVVFTYRHSSVVQVVLRRNRVIKLGEEVKQKIWFYSVYELRRGNNES